jgi:hypothetical protein
MAIMAINIAFGWTVVGWLAALIWSLTGPNYRYAPKTQYLDDDGGQPGA